MAGRNGREGKQRVAVAAARNDEGGTLPAPGSSQVSVTEPPSSLSTTLVGAGDAWVVVGSGLAGTVIALCWVTGPGAAGPPSGCSS